jgi:3-isopropylmalate/(R)-2-methylmalate dehydratase large subunit
MEITVEGMSPLVAIPYSPANVKPVEEVVGEKISQAFIGSCTGGRLEDMRQAANLIRGHRVDKNVRLIVIPASREVYSGCLREGLIEIFNNCGAMILNPGCGLCGGFHHGLLGKGDTMISTQNRNFLGRSGSPEAKIYLASAATVAASAIKGYIADPRELA